MSNQLSFFVAPVTRSRSEWRHNWHIAKRGTTRQIHECWPLLETIYHARVLTGTDAEPHGDENYATPCFDLGQAITLACNCTARWEFPPCEAFCRSHGCWDSPPTPARVRMVDAASSILCFGDPKPRTPPATTPKASDAE